MFCFGAPSRSMDQHFHILSISPGVALPLVLHRRRLLLLLFHPQSSRFSRISLRLIFPSSARRECASAHLLIPAVRLCCHFPFVRLFYPPLQYLFPHQLASSFDFNIPSLSHCLRTSASFWYDVFFSFPPPLSSRHGMLFLRKQRSVEATK